VNTRTLANIKTSWEGRTPKSGPTKCNQPVSIKYLEFSPVGASTIAPLTLDTNKKTGLNLKPHFSKKRRQ